MRFLCSALGLRFGHGHLELAVADVLFLRRDLGLQIRRDLRVERAVLRHLVALALHERVRAVVLGLELAGLHVGQGGIDRRLHVPQRGDHDGVGILRLGVDHVADRELAALLGGVRHAEALRVHHVGTLLDHRERGFLGLRRVEPRADERDVELDLGVHFLRARHEGVHQAVDLGDRIAADHADLVRLGHAARDHAGEVRRFLDVVVEDGEVGRLRLARRAHEERHLRVILGDLARRLLDRERLADDEGVALLRVFAQHALVVRVGHLLGEHVLDLAAVLGGVERLVDAAHPLLLDRYGVNRRDLDLVLRVHRRHGDERRRERGERGERG
jgi:hypothetical protein